MQKLAVRLSTATEALCAFLVVLAVVFNLLQVGSRYLLQDSLSWTEEAMRYVMVWMAFLGSSALVYRLEHPALEMLSNVETRWLRHSAYYISAISLMIFAGIMIWYGAILAYSAQNQTSPAAELPMVYAYAAIPVGGVLILLQAIFLLARKPSEPVEGFAITEYA